MSRFILDRVRGQEIAMVKRKGKIPNLPAGAGVLARRFPEIWESYATLGERCAEAGPLDARMRHLVKIALAAGAGSEGAVHSHVRRGLAEGLTKKEIRHVALLAIPTLGLPGAVRTMTWMDDILEKRTKRR
jgi:alkylhydroperoxidase/carboxymuconolactone decarboxylase family protein YurZ